MTNDEDTIIHPTEETASDGYWVVDYRDQPRLCTIEGWSSGWDGEEASEIICTFVRPVTAGHPDRYPAYGYEMGSFTSIRRPTAMDLLDIVDDYEEAAVTAWRIEQEAKDEAIQADADMARIHELMTQKGLQP